MVIVILIKSDRLAQVAENPQKLTWSKILSSKRMLTFFDIRDKNSVNCVSWGKKALTSQLCGCLSLGLRIVDWVLRIEDWGLRNEAWGGFLVSYRLCQPAKWDWHWPGHEKGGTGRKCSWWSGPTTQNPHWCLSSWWKRNLSDFIDPFNCGIPVVN